MINGNNNRFIKQKDKKKQQKQKDIQILINNIHDIKPNLSEYETEQSIPKNNSSNKQIIMTSIIEGKMKKNLSPNKNIFVNDSTKKYNPGKMNNLTKSINNNHNNNHNNTTDNLNDKQCHDYEVKISKLDKTIRELNNQLSFFKKQTNLCEKNYNSFKNSLNNKKKSKSCSINKQKVNHNKNTNNGQCTPNILYQNKNINKYYLVKNESSFGKLEDFNFDKNTKILGKQLSSFLTENNSCNNFKFNNKNKNSKINNYQSLNSQDFNKKNNLLSNVVYQKKKGSKFLENKTNIINIEHLSGSSENYFQNKSNNINLSINKNTNSIENEKIRCMGQEFEELDKKAIGLIAQFFEYFENKKKVFKKNGKGI